MTRSCEQTQIMYFGPTFESVTCCFSFLYNFQVILKSFLNFKYDYVYIPSSMQLGKVTNMCGPWRKSEADNGGGGHKFFFLTAASP